MILIYFQIAKTTLSDYAPIKNTQISQLGSFTNAGQYTVYFTQMQCLPIPSIFYNLLVYSSNIYEIGFNIKISGKFFITFDLLKRWSATFLNHFFVFLNCRPQIIQNVVYLILDPVFNAQQKFFFFFNFKSPKPLTSLIWLSNIGFFTTNRDTNLIIGFSNFQQGNSGFQGLLQNQPTQNSILTKIYAQYVLVVKDSLQQGLQLYDLSLIHSGYVPSQNKRDSVTLSYNVNHFNTLAGLQKYNTGNMLVYQTQIVGNAVYSVYQVNYYFIFCDYSFLTFTLRVCSNNEFSIPADSLNFNCVAQCPTKFYLYQNAVTCKACQFYCLKCTGLKTCLQCISNEMILFSGRCNCPEQLFFATICRDCMNCFNCQKTNVCLKCQQNLFSLTPLCLANCPTGYIPNLRYDCQKCVETCKECINTISNCITCFEGYLLKGSDCLLIKNTYFLLNQKGFTLCLQSSSNYVLSIENCQFIVKKQLKGDCEVFNVVSDKFFCSVSVMINQKSTKTSIIQEKQMQFRTGADKKFKSNKMKCKSGILNVTCSFVYNYTNNSAASLYINGVNINFSTQNNSLVFVSETSGRSLIKYESQWNLLQTGQFSNKQLIFQLSVIKYSQFQGQLIQKMQNSASIFYQILEITVIILTLLGLFDSIQDFFYILMLVNLGLIQGIFYPANVYDFIKYFNKISNYMSLPFVNEKIQQFLAGHLIQSIQIEVWKLIAGLALAGVFSFILRYVIFMLKKLVSKKKNLQNKHPKLSFQFYQISLTLNFFIFSEILKPKYQANNRLLILFFLEIFIYSLHYLRQIKKEKYPFFRDYKFMAQLSTVPVVFITNFIPLLIVELVFSIILIYLTDKKNKVKCIFAFIHLGISSLMICFALFVDKVIGWVLLSFLLLSLTISIVQFIIWIINKTIKAISKLSQNKRRKKGQLKPCENKRVFVLKNK